MQPERQLRANQGSDVWEWVKKRLLGIVPALGPLQIRSVDTIENKAANYHQKKDADMVTWGIGVGGANLMQLDLRSLGSAIFRFQKRMQYDEVTCNDCFRMVSAAHTHPPLPVYE